jgi:hypothetical protein
MAPRRRSAAPASLALAAALALAGLLLGGCSGESSAPDAGTPKVLIVGIDGATFTVLDPLLAEGKLPTLERLIANGTRGSLRTVVPTISPAIWTSILTGRRREAHGVLDFTMKDATGRDYLVGSYHRKTPALWNIASSEGKTVGFQGWWASWPAEEVNGWTISDRIGRTRWTEWTHAERRLGLTWPPELIDELNPLLIDPSNPPMDEIDDLVTLDDDEREAFLAAEKPIYYHGMSVFKFAWCTQRSFERIALHMMDKGQPDLTGIYLIANDAISHTFWHYYEPEAYDEPVDPAKAERLGKLIPAISIHNDRFLEQLLSRIDPNTVVLIVSDHGFQSSGMLPRDLPRARFAELRADARKQGTIAIGQSGKHHIDGVLIAYGPGIRSGARVDAHIYDIAPTVLALLDLPVPEDADGRVLEELFTPEFRTAHPIRRIPTYDDRFAPDGLDYPQDTRQEEILERLRALGYTK